MQSTLFAGIQRYSGNYAFIDAYQHAHGIGMGRSCGQKQHGACYRNLSPSGPGEIFRIPHISPLTGDAQLSITY